MKSSGTTKTLALLKTKSISFNSVWNNAKKTEEEIEVQGQLEDKQCASEVINKKNKKLKVSEPTNKNTARIA